MTELLERAIAEVTKLSDDKQNAIAIKILTQLETEIKPAAHHSAAILQEIANLPEEGETNSFSGENHDQILYPSDS